MNCVSRVLLAGCVSSVLVVSGCSLVVTEAPLSSDPSPVDKAAFEGTWLMNGGTIQLAFGADGVARLIGLEWKEGDFAIERGEMIVVEGAEFNYLSVRGQENGKWVEHHLLAQYSFTPDGDLVVWAADDETFAAAVLAGKLQGSVDKEQYGQTVLITSEPASLVAFMDDPENAGLFDYKDPMILKRVTPREDLESP